MSKRKWRWVAREDGCSIIYIWNLYRPRPKQTCDIWVMYTHGAYYACVCADEFKKLTGITVPSDKPIKVEFTAKVVE